MKKKTIILILGFAFILISGFIITSRAIYNSGFKSDYNAPTDRKEAWIQDLNQWLMMHTQQCIFAISDEYY